MRRFSEVDRDAQLARRYGQPADVVHVLVRNDDGVQRFGRLAGQPHAAEQLAAAQSGVDQDAGVPAA